MASSEIWTVYRLGRKWREHEIKLSGTELSIARAQKSHAKRFHLSNIYLGLELNEEIKKQPKLALILAERNLKISDCVYFFLCGSRLSIGVKEHYICTQEDYNALVKQISQHKRKLVESAEEDYILLSVLAGSNLPIRDTKTSDPFCTCYFVDSDGNKVSKEKATTQVCKSTLNPVWSNQEFFLRVPTEADTLIIHCQDWDEFGTHDDMGSLLIKISDIPSNQLLGPRWFPIPVKDALQAQLKCEIYFNDRESRGFDAKESSSEQYPNHLYPVTASSSKEALKTLGNGFHSEPAGELLTSICYYPEISCWPALLEVCIHKGRELRPTHKNSANPYVIGYVGKRKERGEDMLKTSCKSKTLNPEWKSKNRMIFETPKLSKEILLQTQFTLQIYDYEYIGDNELIGEKVFMLTDLFRETGEEKWIKFSYTPTKTPVLEGSQTGKSLATAGWIPNYPIICIPGFASSALYVKKGHMKWQGKRLWMDIGTLLGAKLSKAKRNAGFGSMWVEHLCLQEDCISDPEGIKVRAVRDIDGCMFLTTNKFLRSVAYVLGPLIVNLQAIGYRTTGDNPNLLAFPYDWRLSPGILEEKTKYFTALENKIEEVFNALRKPVVLLGHSMGNRMIQYFTMMMKDKHGKKWLDKHVHGWVAVGSPWLGTPKMCRALISGERMGLEMLLSEKDAVTFSRRVGTTLWLVPEKREDYYENMKIQNIHAKGFVWAHGADFEDTSPDTSHSFTTKKGTKEYRSVPYDRVFDICKAPNLNELYEKLYANDPFYGKNQRYLEAPAVDRLWNIYGVNMHTERLYFYDVNQSGKWSLSTKCSVRVPHHVMKEGIAFETSKTPQKHLKDLGRNNITRSGMLQREKEKEK
eukprot:TRINITY_DN1335_c0_g1_i2.p1 TRINITY_DN1335_c0_g1~~TRINITY_DN1335_c0_g1_i2.p1  ORF type:complete len:864 (-),score=121.64 TRINITY_DN1335_c0_g1_i2:1102-3693(-)